MLQWFDSNKNESSLIHFKCNYLNHFCIKLPFSCAHMRYESWESEDFKTILTLTYGGFQTKVMSLSILTWVFFRHFVSIMSHFGIFYNLSYCHCKFLFWHKLNFKQKFCIKIRKAFRSLGVAALSSVIRCQNPRNRSREEYRNEAF